MKKGMTLVELLFVMAIISILAGIGITMMNDSNETAIITTMKSDARNVINEQSLHFMDNGSYKETTTE